MDLYTVVIQNKEVLKIIYGFIVATISLIIVIKTDRLYRLSLHNGIRYFRNAFLFYSLAFLFRYIIGADFFDTLFGPFYNFAIRFLMEFFLIMAGFFLLYSLIWKKLEIPSRNYSSSLLNPTLSLFYLFSFLILFLDLIWKTYVFMFSSQVIIFIFASIIAFRNYLHSNGKKNFLKFYFVAMILSLTTWILNALAASLFNWDFRITITVSAINVFIFLLFLFGVIKFTRIK